MRHDITIPSLGESVTSGILVEWLVDDGAMVQEDEALFELETDKATLSVPSPAAGRLAVAVEAGSEVTVGQTVGSIDTAVAAGTGETTEPAEELLDEASDVGGGASDTPGAGAEPGAGVQELSPAVRALVEEHGLDPATIEGTGKDGRLTKGDVLRAIEASKASRSLERVTPPGPPAKITPPGKPETRPRRDTVATPAADVTGSRSEPPVERRAAAPRASRRVPMTTIRRRTAERLVESQASSAHLTTFNEIDMSRVMALRKDNQDVFVAKHGIKLGFMSFFVRAVAVALREYPEVNARIEDEDIVYHDYYDIGVAVSLDRGLVVPVIRDADALGFAEIERRIADLAGRARDKRLTLDELTGGTFTITNGGIFGSLMSTPIPTPPQTAILGMHSIQKRPVAVDDEVVIRPMMYVALTYDHRIIDGRTAVRFLVRIKELVEHPERLLLDV